MLRVALPKGKLLSGVMTTLKEIGLEFMEGDDRCYNLNSSANEIDLSLTAKIIKVRAVPQFLALGNFQVGFCGLDLIKEFGYEEKLVPMCDLGLNPVRLVVAVPEENKDILDKPPCRPLVIATEYEKIAAEWAFRRSLSHIIVQTWGSTEGFAPDDADIVFDNTETGRTIAANGLVVIDEIMSSSTWLIANRDALDDSRYQGDINYLKTLLQRGEKCMTLQG